MPDRLRLKRRVLLSLVAAGVTGTSRPLAGQESVAWPDWSCAPIGWSGEAPGVGFRIGHGFACENTWFAAGWWHTGEDWYALAGDTAGASVYAVAGGEVVYADFSYPGRVVIVQHADDLFTMYGHLNPESVPPVGTVVVAGNQIGTVLQQADVQGPGQAPSHLHFEVRDFFLRDEVNGDNPQYGVNCGFQCPPGPGYWPQSASTLPVDHGWLNPTEASFGKIDRTSIGMLDLISNVEGLGASLSLWPRPEVGTERVVVHGFSIGDIVEVIALHIGAPDSRETSAEAYQAWANVVLNDGTEGWMQLASPSFEEMGSDSRPSSVDRIALFAPGVG